MSTPNSKDPKKPGLPVKKPDGVAKPGAKPGVPAPKAQSPGKPPAKPPAKPTAKGDRDWDGGKRKIGQIMVDLGFIDESQLWDILEEARTNAVRVGQVALNRGLINDEQLLQAIAEQNG